MIRALSIVMALVHLVGAAAFAAAAGVADGVVGRVVGGILAVVFYGVALAHYADVDGRLLRPPWDHHEGRE